PASITTRPRTKRPSPRPIRTRPMSITYSSLPLPSILRGAGCLYRPVAGRSHRSRACAPADPQRERGTLSVLSSSLTVCFAYQNDPALGEATRLEAQAQATPTTAQTIDRLRVAAEPGHAHVR